MQPLLTLLILLAPMAVQDPASRLHAAARQSIQDGNYAEAQRVLQLLVDGDPDNTAYLKDLADAQSRAGQAADACRSLERWLEVEPDNEAVVLRLSRILTQEGRWPEVVARLQPLANDTQSAELCRLLAQACHHQGLPAEAAWSYEKALRLDPGAEHDIIALSKLHLEGNQPPLAIRTLEQALEGDPRSAVLHYHLARAYLAAGRPLGKVDVRPLAQALPDRTSGPWYVIDALPENPNRYRVCPANSAIYHLHRAFELGLDHPDMHLLSADIWHAAGEHSRARELYETLETTVPPDQQAGYHYRYGMTLYWLDDLDGFEQHLQRALKLDPQAIEPRLAEAYTLLADRHCLKGDRERYIHFLELATARDGSAIEPRYKLGNALYEAGRQSDALEQYRRVLQMDPNHRDRDRMLDLLGGRP